MASQSHFNITTMKKTLLLLALLICFSTLSARAQDGSLDNTFNPRSLSGKITYNTGLNAQHSARQPDGKLLVVIASNAIRVDRFNADGTRDASFGVGGTASTTIGASQLGRRIALQTDGKIVVVGNANAFGTSDFAIVRFNPNGSLDSTFSGDGKAVFGLGAAADDAFDAVIQADGKIVVVGTTVGATTGNDWGALRLNTDGSLDNTFGSNGSTSIKVTTTSDEARSAVLQPDGNIVIAGSATAGEQRVSLGRIKPNGNLDSTFGTNGVLIQDFGAAGQIAESVKLQSDGKIVIAGRISTSTAFVGRFNANGTLDTGFDGDGIKAVTINTLNAFYGVTVQADGKLLCVGNTGGTTEKNDFLIARYNADGTADAAFNGGNPVITNFDGQSDIAFDALLNPSTGKFVVIGQATDGLGAAFPGVGLAGYNANGTLDNAFAARTETGPNFLDLSGLGTGNDEIRDLAIQPDGKIIAVGIYVGGNQDWGVVRYKADGGIDSAFGTNGITQISVTSGANDIATSVALQPDGKIVVAGTTVVSATSRVAVARFNANGTLDNTFAGGAGFVVSAVASSSANDVLMLPDGDILVAGTVADIATDMELFRYNSDGTPDIAFGSGGQVSINFGASINEIAYALALQGNKLMVAGTSNGVFAAARLNLDGSLDNSFDTDGKVLLEVSTATPFDYVQEIAFQNDGKIILGGTASNPSNGNNNNFALARLNANGSVDLTFDTDGFVVTDFGLQDDCFGVAVLGEGKIIAGGFSTSGVGVDTRQTSLVRYNSNGSLDLTLDTDGKVAVDVGAINREDNAFSMKVLPDGKVLTGGRTRRASFDFALSRFNGSVAPVTLGAPLVTATLPASALGATATLSGVLNPNGGAVSYAKFAYGTNQNSLTDSVTVSPNVIGLSGTGGTADTVVSAALTGLQINQTYYYRLVARNSVGISTSNTVSFVTSTFPTVGLSLWLRADSNIVAVSGLVSEWRDVSGNARNATQAAAGSRPALIAGELNGKAVVRFTNDVVSTSAFAFGPNATIIAVSKTTSGSGFQRILNAEPNNIAFFGYTGGNFATFYSNGVNGFADFNGNGGGSIINEWKILTSIVSNGTDSPFQSGLALTPKPEPLGTTNPVMSIGSGAGQSFAGDLAEIFIYSRVISTAERTAVEQYLASKYALPIAMIAIGDEPVGTVPTRFALNQNYPNPFNPSTTVQYALPTAADVSLKIYDVLGREVQTLVSERKAAGNYSVRFNAASLSSGVYFYKLQAGNFVETKKMLFVK